MIELYPGTLVNLSNVTAADFHEERLTVTFVGGEKMRFVGVPAQHAWDRFNELVAK